MRIIARRILLRIGSYFEHRGKLVEALRVYRLCPWARDSTVEFAIGNVLYRQGRYHEAIPSLSRALNVGEPDDILYKRLVIAYLRVDDLNAAEQTLEAYLEKHPNSTWAARQQRELAIPNRSAANQADTIEERLRLAPAWQRANAMRELISDNRSDPAWLYRYASVLQESGRLSEAALEFDAANILSEKSWWSYRAGLAYELNGEDDQARIRYERAVESDDLLDADVWGIGAFHDRAERFELAGKAYEETARASSAVETRARLLARAGKSYSLALDLDASIHAYTRATDLRPRHAEWLLSLATAQELRGDWKGAVDTLVRVCALLGEHRSRSENVHWRLARVFYEQGKYSEALELLRPAGKGRPSRDLSKTEDAQPDIDSLKPQSLEFAASADQKGLIERARVLEDAEQIDNAYRAWRMASLLSAPVATDIAFGIARTSHGIDSDREAVEAILATRLFNSPVPEGALLPKEGSHQYALAMYSEHRGRPIYHDVILYEANLGLSIDCNPLALCRHILHAYPSQFIHVWVTDEGVPLPSDLAECPDVLVVKKNSNAYVSLLAQAKYLINNSTFPSYFTRRSNQRYLMTWHGTPLKTLGKDQPTPLPYLNMARNLLQATYVIFPNEHTRRVLIEGCDVAGLIEAKVEVTGYPRNDVLVSLGDDSRSLNEPKTALFAPTWREDEELDEQVEVVLAVRRVLESAGYRVLLRLHHYVEKALHEKHRDIRCVPRYQSTIDILPRVDLLVTDYSSVYFDFAITGRPIVFYVPDWERYDSKRGLYFEKGALPGQVCTDLDELARAVFAPVTDARARSRFLSEFSPMDDGRSAERVAHTFLQSEPQGDRGPKNVILFRQSLLPNGMASSFVNLAHTLVRKGHQIALLTDGRAVQEEPQRQGVAKQLPSEMSIIGRVGMQPKTRLESHAHRILAKASTPWPSFLQETVDRSFLREASRTLPSSVSAVVEFDGYSEFMARLTLAIGGDTTKRGIYLHSDFLNEIKMRMPELERVVRLFPLFDTVVSVSEGLRDLNAEKLGAAYSVGCSNFRWARNEILPDRIRSLASDKSNSAKEFDDASCSPLITHVGRFSPEKNHEFLLDVMQELLISRPNAHLLLLGDGPLFADITSEISSRGLDSNITCLGQVANPYVWMQKSDALVLPSLHEGQPMVILEARALGVPVLASDVPGVVSMKKDGASKVLPLDLGSWVDALSNIGEQESRDEWDSHQYVENAYHEFLAAMNLVEARVPIEGGRA